MKKIRILIADDHGIIRRGLRTVFKRDPAISIVGEAGDGSQAIELTRRKRPDVAVLDISMPVVNGIEATRILKQELPDLRILILTIYDTEEYVYQMVRAGASGYVLKDASGAELIGAVRSIHAGGRFFSPGISRMMIDQFIERAKKLPDGPVAEKPVLTKRETEVLRQIARGRTNPQIAHELFLSVRTINTHRSNIMHKLDIHDVAGIVRYAIQHGLIELDPKS